MRAGKCVPTPIEECNHQYIKDIIEGKKLVSRFIGEVYLVY